MTMRELLARQAKLRTEARELGAAADPATGNLTAEQQAALDKVMAALDELTTAIQNRARIDEMERRSEGVPLGTGDHSLDRELRSFSVVRAMASRAGLDVDAGREMELSQEIARRSGRPFNGIAVPLSVLRRSVEQRVITTGTPAGTPGGSLIMTDLDGSQYIDLLRAALRIRDLGARYLTGLTSNVDIPRLAQSAAAGWVAENTPLPVSDEGFDKVSLRPHHAGAIVEWSRNMLQQSTPAIEDLVRADLAAVLARVLDSAAIDGTGTANDPVGILNTAGISIVPAAGIGTTAANGSALVYTGVADLIGSVMAANVMGDDMAFLTNTKVRQTASKSLNGQGQPLGLDVFFQGERVEYSNLVPKTLTKGTGTNLSALIYGLWSDLLIGVWSELDILVNPYESTAFSKGNVQVRAMMTCDIQVRHPQSFAAMIDIDTTQGALVYAGEMLNGATGSI